MRLRYLSHPIFLVVTDDFQCRVVPLIPDIYPVTPHRKMDPVFHEREVSLFEPCLVEIFDSQVTPLPEVIPLYKFSSKHDASSYQSILRGKYLRHTFDINSITSAQGEIAFKRTLKLWSDFDDGQRFLTFNQHKGAPMGHRDFPLGWFEPTLYEYRGKGKDSVVRIQFRFAPRKRSLVSSWSSSVINLSRRASGTFRRRSSSSTGPVTPSETNVLEGRPNKDLTDITRLTGFRSFIPRSDKPPIYGGIRRWHYKSLEP